MAINPVSDTSPEETRKIDSAYPIPEGVNLPAYTPMQMARGGSLRTFVIYDVTAPETSEVAHTEKALALRQPKNRLDKVVDNFAHSETLGFRIARTKK